MSTDIRELEAVLRLLLEVHSRLRTLEQQETIEQWVAFYRRQAVEVEILGAGVSHAIGDALEQCLPVQEKPS